MSNPTRLSSLALLVAVALISAPAATFGQKALVYCPVAIDAAGCDRVVTALSGDDFPDGVLRGFDGTDGTVDLSVVDLADYAAFIVPSLADGEQRPYDLLRSAAVMARFQDARVGRVGVWSGTPDQGQEDLDAKLSLLRGLTRWAAGGGGVGTTGVVVLQDMSADAAARYGWLGGITPVEVGPDTRVALHDAVNVLTTSGSEILGVGGGPLAYPAMATYGLVIPATETQLSPAAVGISGEEIVLATYEGTVPGGPEITSVTAPFDPVAVNTTIGATVAFIPAGNLADHAVQILWGDGSSSMAPVMESNGTGSASASHAYAAAGVYTLEVVVSNGVATDAAAHEFITVFNPDGEHVNGNGAIDSSPGAFAEDPSLTGQATFGFQSRYKRGAEVPDGDARFRFRVANLVFESSSYEWLVVSGARAQFKGTGTINRGGDYGFFITAIDGDRSGGGGEDRFRIKIWDRGNEDAVVYDNQMGATDDSDAASGLVRGRITIHSSGQNTAPVVTITSPPDGLVVDYGTAIAFSATAHDQEEGDLSGSIGWSSSLDGFLYSGAEFTRSDLAAGSHTITASVTDAGGLVGTASINLTIAAEGPAEATQLTFGVQPTTTAAGASIEPPVTVRVEDAFGNLVASTATVMIGLGSDPSVGSATLSGTLSAAAIDGIATFGDLSLDEVGTGYTLAATATDLAGAASEAFEVTAGAASQLTFGVQPTTTAAGAAIDPPVTVRIEDAFGNLVASAATVTIALGSDPSAGNVTLSGTLSAAAMDGIATFADLSLDEVGTGYTLAATATDLADASSDVFDVTVGAAAQLVFGQQPTTTAVGAVIDPAVTVRIEDGFGNVVTDATHEVVLSFGTDPSGGTAVLSGTLTAAAVGGIATFSDLSVDELGEGFTLTATSGDLEGAVSAQFTVVAPPSLSVANLVIWTFTSDLLAITLSEPAGTGGLELALVSDAPTTASVPAAVLVPEGAQTVDVPVTGGSEAGIAIIRASAEDFASGSGTVTVQARTMTLTLDELVGVGRTNDGLVTLDEPAPSGGVTVDLTSSNPLIVSVSPSSVFIDAGATTAAFSVTGESEGAVVITASAEGFADATITAGGTNTTVSIGTIPTLVPGESSGLPISLSEPAPPGGLTIFLESDDPDIATVEASVFISEGSQVPAANPQVTGVHVGTAVISASAEGFAPDARTATVLSLAMSVSPSPIAINEGWNRSVTISLSRSAPSGGLTVALTSLDPDVFTVPASAFVPEGQTSVSFLADGISVGTSTLLAEAPNVSSVSTSVTVSQAPSIMMGNAVVGANLQLQHTVRLAETPPEPVDITVTIASGSAALISTSRTGLGSTSITFTGVANTNSQTFWVQGLDEGAATSMTAQAAGYSDRTASVSVTGSGFLIWSPGNFSTTTFSNNTTISILSWRLDANGNIASNQELRAGMNVEVPVTSSDPAVGAITSSPLTFTGGGGSSRTTQFDPLTAGTALVSIAQPDGFTIPSNGNTQITATVTAPNITMSNAVVGADLQLQHTVRLAETPPEPVDITVTIASGSAALLSTSRTGAGSTSITFTGVANTNSQTFWVQGLDEGAATSMTAKAAGYNDRTAAVSVTASGFLIWSPGNFSTTTLSNNTTISILAWRLDANGNIASNQELRGGISMEVPVTSSDPAVGAITSSPLTFTGGGGSSRTTQFEPLTAGTALISVAQPDGFTIPSNGSTQITATVTAPNITMNNAVVGADLQLQHTVRLAETPPEPVDITVTIASGSAALLSTSRTGVGSTSITFTGVANTNSQTFWVQGLDEGATTAMTAEAAGYNDRTASVSVMGSGFLIWSPGNFSTTTFSNNTTISILSWRLDANGNIASNQELRAGISMEVPVTSSNPAVGVITSSPLTFTGGGGSSRTTQFDPLTAGSALVSIAQPDGFTIPSNGNTQITATVTAPNITMSNAAVGADLQLQHTVRLAEAPPEPVDITVTIASGSAALLSTSRTGVGSTSITFTGVTNTNSLTFWVQGLDEGATTSMTAKAAGYNDRTAAVSVTASGFLIWSPGNFSTTTLSNNTTISILAWRLDANGNIASNQELRAGMSVEVPVTSSDPAVGAITSSPLTFTGGGGSSRTTQFDPLTAGTALISIAQPEGFTIPSNGNTQITATVTDG
jgi:hypothetical protein